MTLILALVLIPFAVLVLVMALWGSITPPPVPVQPFPSQSGAASGKDLEPFGWQWCQEPPSTENVPANLAPTEMGKKRTLKHGPLNIQWFWCRAKSSYGLVVLYAQVSNTGDRPVSRVLLDFNLYDRNGSLIGNYSLAIQSLDARGATKVEDKLPAQYAEWTSLTAWTMKLAKINAN